MCASDRRGVRADRRRPQPAGPAAVPRQRDRGRHAVAAARRRPAHGRGPVRPGHVLRHGRAECGRPTSRRSRRSTRCCVARLPTYGRTPRRCGSPSAGPRRCQRRTARRFENAVRDPGHRGLRAVRGHLRLDASTRCDGDAQARARSGSRCPGRRSASIDADGRARLPTASAGEVVDQGRQRHARLPQPARGDRRRPSSTAGCTPATSARSTRTATSSGRPDQGHDHPRRGEHLPQGDRDRRSCTNSGDRSRRPSSARPDEVYGEVPVALRRDCSRVRRSTSTSPRPCAGTSPSQVPGGDHDPRRPAQEPRRQDRQAGVASAVEPPATPELIHPTSTPKEN